MLNTQGRNSTTQLTFARKARLHLCIKNLGNNWKENAITILLLLDAAPMKAIKSSIGGKEVYLKQGILAEIGKKESLKEEHLVAMKQFKPKEDEISGISYHEPPQFPGFKAKPQKQPDVYKRIVSDGKEKWINNEGETKEN